MVDMKMVEKLRQEIIEEREIIVNLLKELTSPGNKVSDIEKKIKKTQEAYNDLYSSTFGGYDSVSYTKKGERLLEEIDKKTFDTVRYINLKIYGHAVASELLKYDLKKKLDDETIETYSGSSNSIFMPAEEKKKLGEQYQKEIKEYIQKLKDYKSKRKTILKLNDSFCKKTILYNKILTENKMFDPVDEIGFNIARLCSEERLHNIHVTDYTTRADVEYGSFVVFGDKNKLYQKINDIINSVIDEEYKYHNGVSLKYYSPEAYKKFVRNENIKCDELYQILKNRNYYERESIKKELDLKYDGNGITIADEMELTK